MAVLGTVGVPERKHPRPAVLLIGGSSGGDGLARLVPRFTDMSYVAATLPYFAAPGLPPALVEIPIERVGEALRELGARDDVDAARIAVFGMSKGGELALAAAARYPQIRATVAVVPSPFAWQGIGAAGSPRSSWTWRGRPVAYVPYTWKMSAIFMAGLFFHRPVRVRGGYDHALARHTDRVAPAFFALEAATGPILLVSAGDDRIWNSPAQCEMAVQYLEARGRGDRVRHRCYPEAGHLFAVASPESPGLRAAMGPFILDHGGSADANAGAREQAWREIAEFLAVLDA